MSEANKEPAVDFQNLLGELETLQKSKPAEGEGEGEGEDGDKKIANAAGEGEEGGEQGDGKNMTKSLQVTLPDGTVVEAEDGTELVKSLIGRLDETESVMGKALGVAVDLLKSQSAQLTKTTDMVKSLQAKVAELSNEGRGRKTMVTMHDKPATTPMTKSEPQGMGEQEFMAKAMDAMRAGKLTGLDVSTAESCINRGQEIPEHIRARVMQ